MKLRIFTKCLLIIALLCMAIAVLTFAILFNSSNIEHIHPKMYRVLIYISAIFSFIAIVFESIVLAMKKKQKKTVIIRHDNLIFPLFLVISICICVSSIWNLLGMLENDGFLYIPRDNIIFKISAIFSVVFFLLIPFLALSIMVLLALSLKKHVVSTNRKNNRVSRKILAVLVGFSISFIISFLLVSNTQTIITAIVRSCLPAFIGSFITGYIVQRRGWIYGCLMIGILEIMRILYMLFAYWWGALKSNALGNWIKTWWIILLSVIIASIGGHIGELLYKTTHKQNRLAK